MIKLVVGLLGAMLVCVAPLTGELNSAVTIGKLGAVVLAGCGLID